MPLGISTYAYAWHLSPRCGRPFDLDDVLRHAAGLGVDLVQICDHAPLTEMDDDGLARVRRTADALGLGLEVGTRGVTPDHLRRQIAITVAVGARVLRTMLPRADEGIDLDTVRGQLTEVLPDLLAGGVTLAIETYEQVATPDLVAVVRGVDSPAVGICSDPSNTVAILETPTSVVEMVAPHVTNMHIKDFAFSRSEDGMGFRFAGAPLGTGLLDYDHMVATIDPVTQGLSQVIEHWMPWQGDVESTLAVEDEWNRIAVEFLRPRVPATTHTTES